MKFSDLTELANFIKNNNLFEQLIDIEENFVGGGSSYNFKIRTKDKDYFLKLTYDPQKYWHLRQIWQGMGYLLPLDVENFKEYQLLAMPYFVGHKIRYTDVNREMIKDFYAEYNRFKEVAAKALIVGEQIQMGRFFTKISAELKSRKIPFKNVILQFFMLRFAKQLILFPKVDTVIHGDMTINNVLLCKQNGKARCMLLDLESIRYGYEIEDICTLLLGISGFRGVFGSVKKFANLYKTVEAVKHYDKKQWLYGVQVFYLYSMYIRLFGNVNRKYKWRKMLCFTIKQMGYFRIAEFLQKQKD